jgi:thiosulfate reductase/polysulfide reductase chain A
LSQFTRRDILKLGLGVGSSLTIGSHLLRLLPAAELEMGGKEVSRTTGKFHQGVASTCMQCYARCGIIGYVGYGRLIKIGGNPKHPNSLGRLCAKGQAGINLLYDPERLLFPLKRAGKRGEGKWQRISWEEAYREIAVRLRKVRDQGSPDRFVFLSERDITTSVFSQRFCSAFGTPNHLSHAPLVGPNKLAAHTLTWGAGFDIDDVAYTNYMLLFGSNPYEAHLLRTSFAQRIAEGRTERIFGGRSHNRAKMVTFDVRLSQSAGRSDEWFPIKPGTDGIVALAMAQVILKEGLHDEAFIRNWTNVNSASLSAHLKPYTPARAEKESGVSAADIRRIAIEFASTKPSTTLSSGGLNKHMNGVENERCILLLNALTGNVDVRGGFCLPRFYPLTDPSPRPPAVASPSPFVKPREFPLTRGGNWQRVLPVIAEGRQPVQVFMTYKSNLVYSQPDGHRMEKILADEKRIPFHVAVGSHLTESSAFADLLLPEATYLERIEVESPPALEMLPFLSLRQPVVKPLGESVAFMDMLIELARRVGGGMEKYFPYGSAEDYWTDVVAQFPGLLKAGGLDYLREHGVWMDPQTKKEYRSYRKKGFATPSGKFEIYSQKMAEAGLNPLPTYLPIETHKKLKEDELILVTFQWNVHTHFSTANCKWLSEIIHSNPAWIHPQTAEKKGIREGDKIRVTSRVGSIETRAYITQGIHPQVIAISDSCGHWQVGQVARAKRFRSPDPETQLVWWGKEGNGVHPNPIIPLSSDPIGGGQAWMDTVVMVAKI